VALNKRSELDVSKAEGMPTRWSRMDRIASFPEGRRNMGKGRYFMGRTMATVGVQGVARLGLVAALLVTGLLLAAPSAQAITFDLTSCHVTGGCGTQTVFGTVTLTQNGANVDVVVSLAGGNRFVETGSADQQLFKFNATGVVAADIVNEATANPLNAVAGGLQGSAGAFNGDGTGPFGFGIECVTSANCNGGSTPVFTGLTFTVLGATIAELTVANSGGNIFVADVLIASNGFTGPVDVTAPIPEPGTLLLLGSGLAGVGLWGRKKFMSKFMRTRA